ncbi:hypothetical protein ACVW1A_001256 [Bradyrhizobium sp. LB1.3]
MSPELRADERRCQVRLVIRSAATCTTPSKPVATSEPCVRQNRVVLAVVATVKPWRRRHLRQPARRRDFRWGEGGQNELGSRESTAYAVKATAQGRLSDLATPVCCCAVSLRYIFAQRTAGVSRHPAFPAPSWTRGWIDQQSSGEMRREDAKACLQSRCELEEWRCRLILRHCERSEAIQSLTAEGFWIASLRSQ